MSESTEQLIASALQVVPADRAVMSTIDQVFAFNRVGIAPR